MAVFMHFKSTSMIFIDRFVQHMSCYNGIITSKALEIRCIENVFFAFCRAHSVQFSRCQFYKLFWDLVHVFIAYNFFYFFFMLFFYKSFDFFSEIVDVMYRIVVFFCKMLRRIQTDHGLPYDFVLY